VRIGLPHTAAALLAASLISVPGRAVFAEPTPVVQWTAVLKSADQATAGQPSALQLSATVLEGWHVYAATQLPGGPTPLRVSLQDGSGAMLTGVASGTVPQKRHDASFDLDTQFYTQAFTILQPIAWRIPNTATAVLPVAVTFQSCNDRECRPPQTVHLSVTASGTVQ
jgi:hypothetical protein